MSTSSASGALRSGTASAAVLPPCLLNAFYQLAQTDEQAEHTWAWLMDRAHELEGLVAHDA